MIPCDVCMYMITSSIVCLQPKSLADFKDDSCDVRDDEFDAPIHFLVKRKGGPELDVVKTLFKLLSCTKADVDLKDAMGRTALHIVCEVCIICIYLYTCTIVVSAVLCRAVQTVPSSRCQKSGALHPG